MLVLTRKKGQSIVIGDNVEICVIDVQGEQVRIGIDAPRNVSVHRKEIYLEIQEENRQAANINNISVPEILKDKIKKDIKK